jgi:hypothetical protein
MWVSVKNGLGRILEIIDNLPLKHLIFFIFLWYEFGIDPTINPPLV